jgi:hypothetical protein
MATLLLTRERSGAAIKANPSRGGDATPTGLPSKGGGRAAEGRGYNTDLLIAAPVGRNRFFSYFKDETTELRGTPKLLSPQKWRDGSMDKSILARKSALVSGALVVLAATLAALLVTFVVARPSDAQTVDPILTVGQTEVGFGAVEVGTTGDPVRTVTIRNTSGAELLLGPVTLLGTDAGQFSLVNPIPVTGLTLGRDGTYDLQVAFNPTTNGTKVAELGFQVVGGGANLPTVNLTGTGVDEPPTSQPGAQGCDIVGTPQGETLTGTPNPETICGLGGNDKIDGLGANDILKGGSDRDRITDKAGKDKLLGQVGRDRLNAKDGARGDLLKGGGGKDRAAKDRKDKARSI